MNYWTNNSEFNKYVTALGSTFAAIRYVSQLARRRAKSVHNCISESQAVAWVITGEEPAQIATYRDNLKRIKHRAKTYVNDRLYYIDDIEIRAAVKITIDTSKHEGHLIYCYNNILDICRQARVRILSNIIWDEIQKMHIDNSIDF